MPFENGHRELVAYPQKREMILLTSRPVQLETPFSIFDAGVITPNDAFFVRWHLAGVPTSIDPSAYKLQVHGRVNAPLSYSLDDLRVQFDPVEITAVCECSGNSRGFFTPRVPGGQWGNGAMGNDKWRGARLKDVLAKSGVKAGAVQVRFNGMDEPALPQTPDFAKSLDIDLATGDDVIVAYAMNGEPLPLLNGYPVRLVVPGYFATYWVKMLNDVEVLDRPDDGYWMKTAYRIPADPCGCMLPGTKVPTVPVSRLSVRSFITNLRDGQKVRADQRIGVRGIAFDSGYGIQTVLFSSDGGAHWAPARLGPDEGRYSFRSWTASFVASSGTPYALQSLAVNAIGEAQRTIPVWNSAGYLRNSIETVHVTSE
jgi:DMSO/TMAO reductase YedYZ molybdopterin-dependent catalytic subunit